MGRIVWTCKNRYLTTLDMSTWREVKWQLLTKTFVNVSDNAFQELKIHIGKIQGLFWFSQIFYMHIKNGWYFHKCWISDTSTYNCQSKIYEILSPPQGCLVPQVQKPWCLGHKVFWKKQITKLKHKDKLSENTNMILLYEYSVSLIIVMMMRSAI